MGDAVTLKTGDLAYFDSMSGLIPCKVTGISGRSGISSSAQGVEAVLTGSRAAYKRGERISTSGLRIVPRNAVTRKRSIGGPRILVYEVQVDEGTKD